MSVLGPMISEVRFMVYSNYDEESEGTNHEFSFASPVVAARLGRKRSFV